MEKRKKNSYSLQVQRKMFHLLKIMFGVLDAAVKPFGHACSPPVHQETMFFVSVLVLCAFFSSSFVLCVLITKFSGGGVGGGNDLCHAYVYALFFGFLFTFRTFVRSAPFIVFPYDVVVVFVSLARSLSFLVYSSAPFEIISRLLLGAVCVFVHSIGNHWQHFGSNV